MIYLNVVDILQQVFGNMVWIQSAPLKDSNITNSGLTFLVSEGDTRPLNQDGTMFVTPVQVTTVIRNDPPDPELLVEADQAVTILIQDMEQLSHIDKAYKTSGAPIPHIDTDIMMRVSTFDITYRIFKR